MAAIAGAFIGLVLGGILGPISWRLVFLVSVPAGVVGTLWSYWKLEERGQRHPAKIDWWGNLTFGAGLILVLVSITLAIQPYGGHVMGWTNPQVLAELITGLVLLAAFVWVELRVPDPMFRLGLFRIRAFTAGSIASFLASLGRGGLMFMLIIWLQGIWLPVHGYSFEQTPLWAGIYMLPLTVGFLVAGPTSGYLSDRFGARPFATGGMLMAAASFLALELLPVDFRYEWFATFLLLIGLAMGLFSSPNQTGIMNSLPANRRGVGSGMAATFQNSAMVLSIGIFFTLMVVGLSGTLPGAMYHGLTAKGVPPADALRISHLPPVGVLFASFLGYNPIKELLGPHVLHHLSHGQAAYLTGRSFFPGLISKPFANGLHAAFDFAIVACLIAAAASWLRGGKYVNAGRPARARHPDRVGRGYRAGAGGRGRLRTDGLLSAGALGGVGHSERRVSQRNLLSLGEPRHLLEVDHDGVGRKDAGGSPCDHVGTRLRIGLEGERDRDHAVRADPDRMKRFHR